MKDGGPAFPATRAEEIPIAQSENLTDWADVTYPGMSLRDWFAGQALAGLLSHGPHPDLKNMGSDRLSKHIAGAAYQIADAMLAAREAQGEEETW